MTQTASPAALEQVLAEIARGIAGAVADRPRENKTENKMESEAEGAARRRAAVLGIAAFQPRDAIEAMLAGQCILAGHLLRDAARDVFQCEIGTLKTKARAQTVAIGALFLRYLRQLRREQARPLEALATGVPATGAMAWLSS